MSYWDYIPICVAVVAVLYYIWTQQKVVGEPEEWEPPEGTFVAQADVLAYGPMMSEADRQELVQYFAGQAYDWQTSKYSNQNNLLGVMAGHFAQVGGMAAEYCENLLDVHTNNERLVDEIAHVIRTVDDIANTLQRVIEEVDRDGAVDLEGELWQTEDMEDLKLSMDHYVFMWEKLAQAGLRSEDY